MGRPVSILVLVVLSALHPVHPQEPQIQLSLEGGSDSNSGRVVVVWYGNTRGTICNDGFDNNDAAVVCRILGKSSIRAVYTSRFGPGTGTVIMSRLGCQGSERDLIACGVGQWGERTGCQHSQDVGVICGSSSPPDPPRPCDNNPCRNGGACINLDQNTRRCDCPSRFEGRDCERTSQTTAICGTIPCKNGGTCNPWQFSPGYYCFCTDGYSGINCTQGQRRPCENQPCVNGGVCRNDGSNYICSCPAGYSGPTCADQTITPAPTPGPRPTQRPNPTPDPGGCRDVFLARPNRVGFNAGHFPAPTITACCDACLTSFPTCYGYDWRGACYLYLNSSNPNNLQVGTGTNYERIFSCPALVPPALGSCRDRFITYQNQYVASGAFVQSSSPQDCANKCLQSSLRCRGYSIWDRFWCFLVLYTHSGSDVRSDTRWTRYQRVFSCQNPGPGVQVTSPSPRPNFTPSPRPASVQVFLVDGNDRLHGRVLVQYNGVLGTVCDDLFGYNDARVICRMLGYFGSDVSAVGMTYGPGSSSLRIWLDNLACRGTERDLLSCSHPGWGRHDCRHNEDVSVACGRRLNPDPPVRPTLEGGSDRLHGRLVLYYNNQPGTVCNDNFGTNDARVICRMLGYRGSSVSVTRRYGQGSGRIWLDNVFCHGNESSISDCFYPPLGTHNCDHSEDVGINCGPISVTTTTTPPSTDTIFTLEASGRVLLQLNGRSGYICSDGFDLNDARVVCRSFGRPSTDVQVRNFPFAGGTVWSPNLQCTGFESRIEQCRFDSSVVVRTCFSRQNAGVVCGTTQVRTTSTTPRPSAFVRVFLVGGQDRLHGRVVVQYNGVNGTVCDDLFGYNDARVICRMLGYFGSDVSAVGMTYGPGSSSSRIWLDNLACRGTERDLLSCSHRGWGRHDCDHTEDVSVVCGRRLTRDPPVRPTLEGGSDSLHGRLVLYYNNQPGTVCDDNFGTNDARVICRMLGYRGSSVSVTRRYGQGSGRIWLDNVFCHGNESSISDCFYPPLGTHDCSHLEDVGINCGPTSVSSTTAAPSSARFILEASGRLILQLNGRRGYICSDGFDLNDARVICRSFGRPSTNVQIRNSPHTGGIVWLINVLCTGSESHLNQCRLDTQTLTTCRSRQNAGVVCGGTQVQTTPSPPGPPVACGTRYNSKIFGGTLVSPGAWPWIAGLQVIRGGVRGFCGAAIIAPQWVITAAHCVDSAQVQAQVLVGTNNLIQGGVRAGVSRIIIHPQYSRTTDANDVALIRLQRPLTYSNTIRPICLNTVSGIPTTECYSAGWGATRAGGDITPLLRSASLPIVPDSRCSTRFRAFNGRVMLCAGVQGGTRDVCGGDSGGPLMCRRQGSSVYDLWGLVTGGAPCGTVESTYGIYADVAQYVTWINSIIN